MRPWPPRRRAHPRRDRRGVRRDRARPSPRASRRSSARRTRRASARCWGWPPAARPIGVYRELIRMHREEGLDFSNVVTFNLDEYYPMHAGEHPQLPPVHVGEPLRPHQHRRARTCTSRAATSRATRWRRTAAAYEQAIRDAGRDRLPDPGHREDGAHRLQRAGLRAWSRAPAWWPWTPSPGATRRPTSSARTTSPPRRSPWASPPSWTRRRSRSSPRASTRRAIVRRAVEGEVDPDVAATYLQEHPDATVYVDRAAAGGADAHQDALGGGRGGVDAAAGDPGGDLAQPDRPGSPSSSWTRWTTGSTTSARCWRATAQAGPLNGEVFNTLLSKIRGKSRLPQRQAHRRLLAPPGRRRDLDGRDPATSCTRTATTSWSPTRPRATSPSSTTRCGRYLDFLRRFGRDFEVDGPASIDEALDEIEDASSTSKDPGEVDIPAVQDHQEGRSARPRRSRGIETFGMRREQARFLNLPFYQTGKVKKDPIGPKDVEIVLELLEEHRPEYVFVAGDLSDPHGTHRMCLQAVERGAATSTRGARPGGLVLPGRLAGVDAWPRPTCWCRCREEELRHEDPGHLQAPEPEGPGALPRPRRARVLAAGGGAQHRHRRASSTSWGCRSTTPWRRTWCGRTGSALETEILSTAALAAPPRLRRAGDHPGAAERLAGSRAGMHPGHPGGRVPQRRAGDDLHGVHPARLRRARALHGRRDGVGGLAGPGAGGRARTTSWASRDLPWGAVLFSVVATETSTLTFLSIPGVAYATDLTFLQLTFGYLLGRIVVAFVLLPAYYRGELTTAYALLETALRAADAPLRLGHLHGHPRAGRRRAALRHRHPAGAHHGLELPRPSILVMGVFTLLYTYHGGIRAVVWVDALQMVLYLGGAVGALAVLLAAVPGGWAGLDARQAAAAGKLAMLAPRLRLDAALHALGGAAGRRLPLHGLPRRRPAHRAAAAHLPRPEAQPVGAHRLGLHGHRAVRPLPGHRAGALGLLRRAALRAHRRDLRHLHHRAAPAGRHRPRHRRHLRRRHVVALLLGQLAGLAPAPTTSTRRCAGRATRTSARAGKVFTLVWGAVLVGGALLFRSQDTPVVELGLAIASFTYGGLLGGFFLGILNRRARAARRHRGDRLRHPGDERHRLRQVVRAALRSPRPARAWRRACWRWAPSPGPGTW